jgi:Kef-type K+ transport system membrane component KefB
VLRLTLLGFAISFGVALVVSLGLSAADLVDTPLLVAIILCSTSLGVLVPVLKDSGQLATTFGQLIIAAASIADFGAIILLSIFFSGEGGTGSTLLLLGALFALAAAVFFAVKGAERSRRLRETWCGCRTRPRRSASAPRSCCWSASPPWPSRSGSR